MCFSMDWLLHVLLLGVFIGAVVKILQLVIPYAVQQMGGTIGEGVQLLVNIFRIIFIAVVVSVILIVAFQLIACLWSYVGGMGNILPHTGR